jgi:hypothetical protein
MEQNLKSVCRGWHQSPLTKSFKAESKKTRRFQRLRMGMCALPADVLMKKEMVFL